MTVRGKDKDKDDMPAELDFSKLGPPSIGKYYSRAMAGVRKTKETRKAGVDEMRADLRQEYRPEDFAGLKAERGKYAEMLRKKSNIGRIAPDVHRVFPNEDAVNTALRGLIAKRRPKRAKSAGAKRAAR